MASDSGFEKRLERRLKAAVHRQLDAQIAKVSMVDWSKKPVRAMSAATELEHFVEQLVKQGRSRTDALKEVFKQHPQLREAMVRQGNAQRNG